LDYFYEDGAQTDLTWDDNPLRCTARNSPPRFTSRTTMKVPVMRLLRFGQR